MNSPGKTGIFRKGWAGRRRIVFFFLFISLMHPLPATSTTPPPQANSQQPLPPTERSLSQQESPISEESDGPFHVWKEKDKYFLVIAVDQTGLKTADIDLSRVNAPRVADTLTKLGYKPLLQKPRFLNGEQSNRANVLSALEMLKNLPPPAAVIVYYSGHGITSASDNNLWLQLSGQEKVGAGDGVSLNEVVRTPRKQGYHGEVIVILDASYSGESPLSQALAVTDLGEKTIIFASSSSKQNSQTLRLPEGEKSAFTHTLLKGLSSQWSTADENRDGVLRFAELGTYSRIQLQRHFQNKDIPELMVPKLISFNHEEFFIAYKREEVRQWATDDRQVLQILALERALSPSMRRGNILAKAYSGKPGVSKRAKFLAQHISPNSNDLYTKGLIALAQGPLEEARTLLEQVAKNEETNPKKLAKVYLARGRTEVYAGRFRLAVVWYKKSLALEPPVDAKLMNEFGLVWVKAGLFEEALPFFEEGLALREKTLDPMDPVLAVSLNNLAGLYHKQGKYPDAESLYQRALQITENAVGPDHSSLVVSLNNLARLYRDQGRYAEAEPLYQRALQITERGLGAEHPKVVPALHNLAEVYRGQGKYAEVEPLYQRVAQIDEITLGPIHPRVANDLNNLALIYGAQGKYDEAEPVYQRVVEIDEASLGPNHFEVAIDLNNLAELYRTQGKYAEAEPLYLRSHEIMRRQFGLTHLKTRTVLNNYLRMLSESGQVDKANRIKEDYQQALRMQSPP